MSPKLPSGRRYTTTTASDTACRKTRNDWSLGRQHQHGVVDRHRLDRIPPRPDRPAAPPAPRRRGAPAARPAPMLRVRAWRVGLPPIGRAAAPAARPFHGRGRAGPSAAVPADAVEHVIATGVNRQLADDDPAAPARPRTWPTRRCRSGCGRGVRLFWRSVRGRRRRTPDAWPVTVSFMSRRMSSESVQRPCAGSTSESSALRGTWRSCAGRAPGPPSEGCS